MITTKETQLAESLLNSIKERCLISFEKKEHIKLHLTTAQAKAGMFIPSESKYIGFCPCGYINIKEKRDNNFKLIELSIDGCDAK